MGIKKIVKGSLGLHSVSLDGGLTYSEDLERVKGYSLELVSLADDNGVISEACAPDWLKKEPAKLVKFPVKINKIGYYGTNSSEDDKSCVEHHENFSWEEFVSLGKKTSISVNDFYLLE
ncbi:hypothetical protein HOE04_01190 [archaeon]|jgi:hypothetical protein|nr:hypothetical protein [archaeon]